MTVVGLADLVRLLNADPSGKLLENAAQFAGYEKVSTASKKHKDTEKPDEEKNTSSDT
jgi:hypothetical protein